MMTEDFIFGWFLFCIAIIIAGLFTWMLADDSEYWEEINDDCSVKVTEVHQAWYKDGPNLVSKDTQIYCKSELVEKK